MDPNITNNLKDEEAIGGFTPGSSDDETFLLENIEEYPGVLPYEVPKTEPETVPDLIDDSEIEAVTAIPEIPQIEPTTEIIPDEIEDADVPSVKSTATGEDASSEFDIPPGTSVWDMFDGEQTAPVESVAEEPEPEIIPPPQKMEIEPEEAIPPYEKSGLIGAEIPEPKSEIEKDGLDEEEEVSLDDDLKQMLEHDMAKSKERNLAKEPAIIPMPIPVSDEAFVAVEDLGDTTDFDLTKIDAEHPSTAGLQSLGAEPEAELAVFEVQTPAQAKAEEIKEERAAQKAAEKKAKKAEKEKKKDIPPKEPKTPREKKEVKKPIPLWTKIGAAAVLVFLASSLLIGYFFLFKKDKLFDTAKKLAGKSDSSLVKKAEPKKAGPKAPDSTVKTVEPSKDLAVKQPEIKKEVPKPAPVEKKPKQLVALKIEKKPEVKLTVKREVKLPVIAKDEKPNRVSAPKPTADNKKNAKPSVKEGELYTVEVYSTPSKDDADDWLKKLKSRNLSGSIKTQKIRDVVWYKVRFGNYTSRDMAKQAAHEHGFAQTWIDRIK